VRPAEVARRHAAETLGLSRPQERELEQLVPAFYDGSITLSQQRTLDAMADEYRHAWEARSAGKDTAAGSRGEAGEDPAPAGKQNKIRLDHGDGDLADGQQRLS
jgi:hypothetical protein